MESDFPAAKEGLDRISKKDFCSDGDCLEFLDELANVNGINVQTLISQIKATAIIAQAHLYDGPSSTVRLDMERFALSKIPKAETVGEVFKEPGWNALSDPTGPTIWLNAWEWESGIRGGLSAMATWGGTAEPYGLGTLLHELLHKQMVGGGFNHSEMISALNKANAPRAKLTYEPISYRIGRLCFE